MISTIESSQNTNLEKIKGRITHYKKSREMANFFSLTAIAA